MEARIYQTKWKLTELWKSYIKSQEKSQEKFNNCHTNKFYYTMFEYYTSLKLMEETKNIYKVYPELTADEKDKLYLPSSDQGIDVVNLNDHNNVVQCKLRSRNINVRDISTFLSLQLFTDENNDICYRDNMQLVHNDNVSLSNGHLSYHKNKFISKTFNEKNMRVEIKSIANEFIEEEKKIVIDNQLDAENDDVIILREYQIEAINKINRVGDKNGKTDVIINLPTGSGKNIIITYAMKADKKYLILVPRIILLDQMAETLRKFRPELKLQKIGGGELNKTINDEINVVICVYNSIDHVKNCTFDTCFIDEAHHIIKPMLYMLDDEYEEETKEDNYLTTISSMANHKILLSATIDTHDEFDYYTKDIRSMINNNYLCDYNIKIPVFIGDTDDAGVCKYIIEQNYTNTIIYCANINESKRITKLLNSIESGFAEHIDCNTSITKRREILNKFKNNQLKCITNCRILVEGFNAAITKNIVFLHPPTNKIATIQIIGRALRLHNSKTVANIILPYNKADDSSTINSFLRIIADNDIQVMNEYRKKRIGNRIDIVRGNSNNINGNDNIDNLDESDYEYNLVYEQIYTNMGTQLSGSTYWHSRFNDLKLYIEKYKSLPSCKDKNSDVKRLGVWWQTQQKNYKKKIYIMKNSDIYSTWKAFITDNLLFRSNEERWMNNFNKLKLYIKKYKSLPSQNAKNINIKQLGQWLSDQQKNYKKKRYIMKNNNIYSMWEAFTITSPYFKRT